MKVKKISSFVTALEDVKDQDIITLASEGEWNEGKYGNKMVIIVRLANDEEKKLTLNTTTFNTLISEFGDDTKDWINKEARVHIVKSNVGGEFKNVIFLTHPAKNLEGEIIHE